MSKKQREDYAYRIYDEFDVRRKHKDAIDADREDMEQLKELEAEIKLRIR